jgi:hypothetical protein
MKFGEALELCRNGARIKRSGWNGKNQFVYYQEGSEVLTVDLRCPAIKAWAIKEGILKINIMGHFDIKTTADVVQCGWLASQGDMQAEDCELLQ